MPKSKSIRKSVKDNIRFTRAMANLHGWAVNEMKRRKEREMKEKLLSKKDKM